MFNIFKKFDPDFFINFTLKQQLLFIILISSGLILVFSIIMDSTGLGISLFLDPGNYADAFENHPTIGMIEAIIGVIFSGALISTITSGFVSWAERSKLAKLHVLILEAFDTIPLIKTRKLLTDLELESKLRMFNIDEAEIRLEIPKADIIQVIQLFGNLRLRYMKDTKETVIEAFSVNKAYGHFENRDSQITLISTQNYSDAGIGHFADALSFNVGANYISNEFYSSGAPLKKKQINFSSNDCYSHLETKCENEILSEFIEDCKTICANKKLLVYIGTSNGEREHDIHVLFGGELGHNDFNVSHSSYTDTTKLEKAYLEFKSQLLDLNIKVATHEEFGNKNEKHLSQALRKHLNAEVITIYISTKILWARDDTKYYQLMKNLKTMLLELD